MSTTYNAYDVSGRHLLPKLFVCVCVWACFTWFIRTAFKAKPFLFFTLRIKKSRKKDKCVEMIDDGEDAERQCVTSQHAQTHSYQTPTVWLSTLISLTQLSTSHTCTHTQAHTLVNPVRSTISDKK